MLEMYENIHKYYALFKYIVGIVKVHTERVLKISLPLLQFLLVPVYRDSPNPIGQ